MVVLDDICFWHTIAEDEKDLNDMNEVIQSYKKIGCYDCDGYNTKCIYYKKIEDGEINYNESEHEGE